MECFTEASSGVFIACSPIHMTILRFYVSLFASCVFTWIQTCDLSLLHWHTLHWSASKKKQVILPHGLLFFFSIAMYCWWCWFFLCRPVLLSWRKWCCWSKWTSSWGKVNGLTGCLVFNLTWIWKICFVVTLLNHVLVFSIAMLYNSTIIWKVICF